MCRAGKNLLFCRRERKWVTMNRRESGWVEYQVKRRSMILMAGRVQSRSSHLPQKNRKMLFILSSHSRLSCIYLRFSSTLYNT